MLLMDFESFCSDSTAIWSVVGWLLTIFKIVIPILMIIFGSIDFGRAVVAQKDDEIKKAGKQLAIRAVAGLIIFILPSVIKMVIGWALDISNTEMNYEQCLECAVSPNSAECKNGTGD